MGHHWLVGGSLLLVTWIVLAGLPGSPVKGKNRAILGVGCLTVTLGLYVLTMGFADESLSLTWAPVLLVLGYCILIPASLLRRQPSDQSDSSKPSG